MNRKRMNSVVLVALLVIGGMAIVPSVNAAAGKTQSVRMIDYSNNWHLTATDNGRSYGSDSLGGTRSGGWNAPYNYAYAETEATFGSATQHSGIYTEFMAATGYNKMVWANLIGWYGGEIWSESANPLITDTDAYIYWWVQISTVSSAGVMTMIALTEINRMVVGGFGVFHETIPLTQYSAWAQWTAVPGTTYRVEAFMKCHASGEHAHAAANNGASRGIWSTSYNIYTEAAVAPGCVAEGTSVTMADGSIMPVERIRSGDKILGYDLESRSYCTETVQWTSSTKVDLILSINDGALRVTPRDQPIYVRNATGEGWTVDPCDIQIGSEILNLQDGSWVHVFSLSCDDERTKVFDFQTDGPMTYLANGYLVLDKGHR